MGSKDRSRYRKKRKRVFSGTPSHVKRSKPNEIASTDVEPQPGPSAVTASERKVSKPIVPSSTEDFPGHLLFNVAKWFENCRTMHKHNCKEGR